MTTSHNLGFPRIGERRELKKATEAYWAGDLDRAGLEAAGAEIRRANWQTQRAAGIDLIPSNDFSFYDQLLDMACLVGNVPARFDWDGEHANLDLAFDMARGTHEAIACEMTKWFDTNYHYLVPEFTADTRFKLAATKVFDEFAEARPRASRPSRYSSARRPISPLARSPMARAWISSRSQISSSRSTWRSWIGWPRPGPNGCRSTSRSSRST